MQVRGPIRIGSRTQPFGVLSLAIVTTLLGLWAPRAVGDESADEARALLRGYCIECHGDDTPAGHVDLARLISDGDVASQFRIWEKVIQVLQANRMPPPDAEQPQDSERQRLVAIVHGQLRSHIDSHAGDPGPVLLRRLTSAEYAHSIQDLTGLDLRLERSFVNDAVGGEGFTNVGTAQFMQDAALERYLEASKTVAEHAVIGAGSIEFFKNPGQTGRELSAIDRILRIYRQAGFRTAAGEGGEPFGLDLYPRAFWVAWQYQHRARLGREGTTLAQLAQAEGLSVRFSEHIWNVVSAPGREFPMSLMVERWQALPSPSASEHAVQEARAGCDELGRVLREWQSMLANAAGDEEEAAVLTTGELAISAKHVFKADINWARGATTAEFELSVTSASSQTSKGAIVVWKNARLRFLDKDADARAPTSIPLASCLTPDAAQRLAFGRHPQNAPIGEYDFVLDGEATVPLALLVPQGMRSAQLDVDVELDLTHGANRIVRCRIVDGKVEGETAAETGATSSLLADPANSDVAQWKAGVAEFARWLPEVSQREPAPSDRDPIPPPFDNAYNQPERNHFHTAIKYHRDDRFLVEHILDDATRRQLDLAWTDLLTSFEYHAAYLRFICRKSGFEPAGESFVAAAQDACTRLPADSKHRVEALQEQYLGMQAGLSAAEPGHVDEALQLAECAWRRPLTNDEVQRLRSFYQSLRSQAELDHVKALRALLARILVAPAFLYHVETGSTFSGEPEADDVSAAEGSIGPLSDWELASRLSYFLWSSVPDDELRRAAAAGELRDTDQLAVQVRRMLLDAKSRRLATEFFGQWFGLYRFDDYRGIDARRFPEFDEQLRGAMYEEAVSFFTYVVREDRAIDEILLADYTFVNAVLARHYGLDGDFPVNQHVRVTDVAGRHRGGLLGMGALHAVTSAPLRTSAVKRGDWVLRRVLGTPVPPPPADAGSIAPDDLLGDGRTVRQRLEAHRTQASCRNCHARIDPLGFALEQYDPIGRWRDAYRDGQPIDPSGTLADGSEINGPGGLREFLRREHRHFEHNLCVKLLGYSLGRSELLSDRPLLDQMRKDIEDGGRFSQLVVRIVTSRQFRSRRT